ncbi:hypothetical protein PYW07_008915 [Mythimna separata]|uniref:MADF domain-containing protein n=1 Tax=Mythimna separata TaxID=271217 RepID=A0AAD8DM31_MYTSE|nr:hypothetical protein PYW07_008915 [Mythimna separata]
MEVEEKLISLVKQHECLYNINSRNYSDKLSKQNTWDDISNEMGFSVQECIIKWKRLRENFRKALKTREKSDSAKRRPIKFEWDFEFLKPYVKDYDQICNSSTMAIYENTAAMEKAESYLKQEMFSEDVDFDEFTDAHKAHEDSIPQPNPSPGNVTPTVAEVLQNYLEANSRRERDPIDAFFLAMAAHVKRLPQRLQVQVKQKVFNAVTEAELKVLNQGA